MKHTPWQRKRVDEYHSLIADANGRTIVNRMVTVKGEDSDKHAYTIINSVNHHDKLVEALKKADNLRPILEKLDTLIFLNVEYTPILKEAWNTISDFITEQEETLARATK